VTVVLSRPEPGSPTEPPDTRGVDEQMGHRRLSVPLSAPRPARFAVAALVALSCAAGLSVAVSGSLGVGPLARAAGAPAEAAGPCAATWVTAWQAAPQAAQTDDGLTGSTLRMIVHPQVAGERVRVRLSNAYGSTPLEVGAVSAAGSAGGAELVPGSERAVTFSGRPAVTVPGGAEVVSDPVPLAATAGAPLAVSLYLTSVPDRLTRHAVALQTSYRSGPGDATASGAGAFPDKLDSWSVLTGLDVFTPHPVNALVAVGDSITDGVGSGVDNDERWTDDLARRLTDRGAPPSGSMVVLNAGIARNRLLDDDPLEDGDSPMTRFHRDVLGAAGSTDVVLHIGTNDIAVGHGATEIVDGLRRYVTRARAAGKRVFLTTITPSLSGAHGTRGAVNTRNSVNSWIRQSGPLESDGVFDFAAAVADPDDPEKLAAQYDSGDGLHLSAAGYQALADAVDTGRLTGSPCLADPAPVQAVSGGTNGS
jgi:lysophospholipase L1-like esterase